MTPAWIPIAVLAGLPDMGPARLGALLANGDPASTLEHVRAGRWGRLAHIATVRGVVPELLATWTDAARQVVDDEVVEAHRTLGVEVDVVRAGLPARLADDIEAPPVLFRHGRPLDETRPIVAIVGTRRCTGYGLAVTRRLASEPSTAGVAIVSGLALGIDAAAHSAALDADGVVIGVVGSGLDVVYPQRNRGLWQSVARDGTLVSEYPLGTPPARWRFPARNRIIAALADVVVVVESGASGGSLYTVDAALERDRTVMAVPGPVTSAVSEGTNRLIAEGCLPVCGADDVLTALGLRSAGGGAVGVAGEPVLEALGWEPATVDELMLRTGGDVAELASSLVDLERRGMVAQVGGWWQRVAV